MKILIVCDQGVNRSVVLGSRLRYCGPKHDVLTVGLLTNSYGTIAMLTKWADRIILTDKAQEEPMKTILPDKAKVEMWNIGPDKYPRPHNKELLGIVTKLIDEHPEYKEKQPISEQEADFPK